MVPWALRPSSNWQSHVWNMHCPSFPFLHQGLLQHWRISRLEEQGIWCPGSHPQRRRREQVDTCQGFTLQTDSSRRQKVFLGDCQWVSRIELSLVTAITLIKYVVCVYGPCFLSLTHFPYSPFLFPMITSQINRLHSKSCYKLYFSGNYTKDTQDWTVGISVRKMVCGKRRG